MREKTISFEMNEELNPSVIMVCVGIYSYGTQDPFYKDELEDSMFFENQRRGASCYDTRIELRLPKTLVEKHRKDIKYILVNRNKAKVPSEYVVNELFYIMCK